MFLKGFVLFLLFVVVAGTYVPAHVIVGWGNATRKWFASVYLLAMFILLILALVSAYNLYAGQR